MSKSRLAIWLIVLPAAWLSFGVVALTYKYSRAEPSPDRKKINVQKATPKNWKMPDEREYGND
jgi:hypothetical protein